MIAGKVGYAVACVVAVVVLVVSGVSYKVVSLSEGFGNGVTINNGASVGAMNILVMGLESRTDYEGNVLPNSLLTAMHAGNAGAVAAGQGVLSPAVTRPLLDLVHDTAAVDRPKPGLEVLTERERAVALAVADGATNAEIARQLYVSAATVKAAVSRILTKLELGNRVQIAVVVRNSRPR